MTSENSQALLDSASAELQQGNLDAGEKLLNRYLAIEPNNAIALDLASRVALHRGELDKAEQYARRAVSIQPVAALVLSLAEAVKAKGNLKKAAGYFSKVLEKSPQELRALIGIGEIYEQADLRREAIDAYTQALAVDPKNVTVAMKYFGLLQIPELTKGLEVLDRARPAPDAPIKHQMSFLHQYIVFKEWAERARRGQMPHHSATLAEFFFEYAKGDRDEYERLADQMFKNNPIHPGAASAKSVCLFSRDDRIGSERYFQSIASNKPGSVYDNIVFQPDFYRELGLTPDADLEQRLPPLIDVLPATFSEEHVTYLSCNYDYYVSFARPMLMSLAAVSKRPQIHLHIMDGSDEDWASAKAFCEKLDATVAISAERPRVNEIGKMEARCYYHAIRFLRLHHHLKFYNKTLWLMDVDALINRDPRDLFKQMGDADVAFRARPGRWEPWNQHNASVIAIRPTDRGRTYLRLIAAYVSHFYKQDKLRWGIDQLAMYGVFCFLKDEAREPRVFLLNNHHVDYEYYDDGFVWCNSGRGKFIQLEQMARGLQTATDPQRAKYFDSLMKYTNQLN